MNGMNDQFTTELFFCLFILGVITAIVTPMLKALLRLNGPASVAVGLVSAVIVLVALALWLRRQGN